MIRFGGKVLDPAVSCIYSEVSVIRQRKRSQSSASGLQTEAILLCMPAIPDEECLPFVEGEIEDIKSLLEYRLYYVYVSVGMSCGGDEGLWALRRVD